MATVTISKNEYLKLRKQANAYQKMAGRLFEAIIKDPVKETVYDFRKTNLYTKRFLNDLEKGLSRSSYAKSRI